MYDVFDVYHAVFPPKFWGTVNCRSENMSFNRHVVLYQQNCVSGILSCSPYMPGSCWRRS